MLRNSTAKMRFLLVPMFLLMNAVWAATPGSMESAELADRLQNGAKPAVLDVRTATEFAGGHIAGAINVPHNQLADRLAELPFEKDSEVVVYCRSGGRAKLAADVLLGAGFESVRILNGHINQWQAEKRPLVGATTPTAP